MLAAIHFDDESRLHAHEVCNVRTQRNLAAKPRFAELAGILEPYIDGLH